MYTQWQSHPRQITVVLVRIAVLEDSDSAAAYCLLSRLRRPPHATRLLVSLETLFTPIGIYTTLVQESDKIPNSLHLLSDSSQNFPPPSGARSFAHICTTHMWYTHHHTPTPHTIPTCTYPVRDTHTTLWHYASLVHTLLFPPYLFLHVYFCNVLNTLHDLPDRLLDLRSCPMCHVHVPFQHPIAHALSRYLIISPGSFVLV